MHRRGDLRNVIARSEATKQSLVYLHLTSSGLFLRLPRRCAPRNDGEIGTSGRRLEMALFQGLQEAGGGGLDHVEHLLEA